MSKYLYVSTDAKEVQALIEPGVLERSINVCIQSPGVIPGDNRYRYRYHDIDMHAGSSIAKRIGFNPMSSVEFNDFLHDKYIRSIAKSLVKLGLFAATESKSSIEKFFPPYPTYPMMKYITN